uniref:Uncharacterized protein n=1 Tax=Arundo donax TaxID=35708 RepID=A0A0A8Z1R1_ARUDO
MLSPSISPYYNVYQWSNCKSNPDYNSQCDHIRSLKILHSFHLVKIVYI